MNCQISGCANTATLKISVNTGQYAGTTFFTCDACKETAVSTLGKHAKVESLVQRVGTAIPVAPKPIVVESSNPVRNMPNLVGATAFSMILVTLAIMYYNNFVGWASIAILLVASGVGIYDIAELLERRTK